MDELEQQRTGSGLRPIVALLAILACWLWPLGLGGRMPVGGDVTRFSIGLMAELHRAYHTFRLPLWNDLWGFGFPGLAESQMGFYYPPHVVLYGLFPPEIAYTASLVFHTFWGGIGAFWAARKFGGETRSAALAGLAWAASGFFVIHLPHQWAYTVGSWMPWAWGLAWPLAIGTGTIRDVLRLAAVLTLQVLPGHFQLAFITQVGVLGLAVWGLIERPAGSRAAVRSAFGLLTALGLVAFLGACQLIPTYELAREASHQRDFEYLSGFAASPLHLVSYIAPGLFHRSALWRPVAWDPFHTSPEEQMAYIGLVPLFLALGQAVRGWKQDRATRVLCFLVLLTLVLSLGPYFPGFAWLIRLPGFSFFRAPARWGLATELALALLAAKGLTSLATWKRPGWSLAGFVIGAAILICLPIGLFEIALANGAPGRQTPITAALDRALHIRPWNDGCTVTSIMAEVRRPAHDSLVISRMVRAGDDPTRARLDRDRLFIYRRELGPTAGLLGSLLILALLARWREVFPSLLMVFTVADLLTLGQSRALETAPLMPLPSLSPVLRTLELEPRGTRITAELGNLPIVAGVASVQAYRTLDRPAQTSLTTFATHPVDLSDHAKAYRATLRALGATICEAEAPLPAELRSVPGRLDRVFDPWLAVLADQPMLPGHPHSGEYTLWRPAGSAANRAWFVPTEKDDEVRAIEGMIDPGAILDLFTHATPLPFRIPVPERFELEFDAPAPGLVIITRLDDPEWRATLRGREETGTGSEPTLDSRRKEAHREVPVPVSSRPPSGPVSEHHPPVQRLFAEGGLEHGGWQGVRVPGAGHWSLELVYRGRAAYVGLGISAVAWIAWMVAYWWFGRGFVGMKRERMVLD